MVRIPTHPDAEAMLLSLLPRPAPQSETEASWTSLLAVFASALSRLNAEERVYLKMWLLDGCAEREIARAFHLDVHAFRRRFHSLLLTVQRHVVEASASRHGVLDGDFRKMPD